MKSLWVLGSLLGEKKQFEDVALEPRKLSVSHPPLTFHRLSSNQSTK